MWRIAALLLFFIPGVSYAISENEALAISLADARKLPDRETQLVTRYVWITDGDFETIQANSLTTNYWSRGTVPLRPLPIGKHIIRIDLRHYAPRPNDLKEVLQLWEEFRFDPRFNLLITKDTLKFLGIDLKDKKFEKKTVTKIRKKTVEVPPYVHTDGKTYNAKEVDEEFQEEVDEDVLRIIGEHIDLKLIQELIDITGSQAPVVNSGYYLTRALTTIKGKNKVFQTIYRGLYYDLSGIKKGFKKGTDEDNLFEKLGIGNIEQGVNAKKVFDDIRSDQRVAKFLSEVAKRKPRRIDLLRTLAGRDTQGIVSVTHDLKDDDIDIGTHPVLNLIDFKDAAREVIFEKLNGLHGFVLFNGEGALQEVVPPDVAGDSTIPDPYGNQLQPAISCIRCHKSEGGWKKANNDVKKLVGFKGLDVFGDRSDAKKHTPDITDRLVGLYSGDLEFKIFPRGRDDYAGAILNCTGPWKNEKNQLNLVRVSGDKISVLFAEYNYTPIGAVKVLQDLGEVVLDKDKAHEQLTKLLPPVNVVIDGIIPEDGIIGALKAGLKVNRFDYDLKYAFIANRYQKEKTRLKLLEKKP